MGNPIMQYFEYEHLTMPLPKAISADIAKLAQDIDGALLDCPEKSAGMRKLLEAKDCFVRAAVTETKIARNL
jgi:hypothetical protein